MEEKGIAFAGREEALAVPRTDLRLFGKPDAFTKRRMGVAVANAVTTDQGLKKAGATHFHGQPEILAKIKREACSKSRPPVALLTHVNRKTPKLLFTLDIVKMSGEQPCRLSGIKSSKPGLK